MRFRYRTTRGLRIAGEPFDSYEGAELRSEDYETLDEFCQAIAEHVLNELEEISDGSDEL